jgi:hypothetical protein
MWTPILALAAALGWAEPSPSPGVGDPIAFVGAGYAAYERGERFLLPDGMASRRLVAEQDAHGEAEGGQEVGSLDAWIDGTEWQLSGLEIRRRPGRDPARQAIAASFRNYGRPVSLRFLFVRENGAWYLDEILNEVGGRSWTLTSLLRLRPFPNRPSGWDAEAEAGRGIHDPHAFLVYTYSGYLHGDAGPDLTDRVAGARPRVLLAGARTRGRGLDIDFRVNASDWSIADLALAEEQGGRDRRTIAARFRNHGRREVIRFHFLRTDGRWFLDEVVAGSGSGDGGWTLSALLAERPG